MIMYNSKKVEKMSKNIENTRIDKAEYKRIMTNRINEVLESEKGTDFNALIFKGYIEKNGANNLVLSLNQQGYRVITPYGSRKWLTTDIREFVLNPVNQTGVEVELVKIVLEMVNYTGRASFDQRLFRSMKKVFKL